MITIMIAVMELMRGKIANINRVVRMNFPVATLNASEINIDAIGRMIVVIILMKLIAVSIRVFLVIFMIMS